VFKTAGYGVEVETSPFFSVNKISYYIKIVQNSKYLTDLLDGTNLFDAWNAPNLTHKKAVKIHINISKNSRNLIKDIKINSGK